MIPPSELASLSNPCNELSAILRANGPGSYSKPMLSVSDIHTARAFIRLFNSVLNGSKPKSSPTHKVTNIQVPVRDGTVLPGRMYTPKRPSSKGCPALYVCHGGGYVIGELEGQDWICEIWAGLGGVAVDVLYRHAPEFTFPVPVGDAIDGFAWVSIAL
jgi:acetyl esterase/lipase